MVIPRDPDARAYAQEKAVQDGALVKVGVNKYVVPEEDVPDVELHEHDPRSGDRQVARLREVRKSRSTADVQATLTSLARTAERRENVMPALVACCKAYCTVGEMADTFRRVFGEFQEPALF